MTFNERRGMAKEVRFDSQGEVFGPEEVMKLHHELTIIRDYLYTVRRFEHAKDVDRAAGLLLGLRFYLWRSEK